MLVSLTREKFEQLMPLTATATQYKFCWGKLQDFLRRLSVSFVGGAAALLLRAILGPDFFGVILLFAICAVLYWLWAPVLWATLRNREMRKIPYSGFWQGEVLDAYVSEELIGKEETVNKRGELVIVENRERRLNLEVGDESGFTTQLQVPLKREHQGIRPGLIAAMVVLSYEPDLADIVKVSDIYIPSRNIWVSDYPYLRRDLFVEVARRLGSRRNREKLERPSRRSSRKGSRKRRVVEED
ncbi:phosphate ABC transporter permease [Leptolyngbya sp. 'hensonii']|uniref:phosphate ABC transporter permease n=1 Tax=Leptolyngbya sp. 'hensonii' TaxID=1922337 RepID=UPI00094F81E6|nr:phosphate ABC transporter permease [Leptolyngbya sp. 'hensonii']OLP16838.1 phosphate ABC transporter permease [Leptolyngbya sp. 'hensonii']